MSLDFTKSSHHQGFWKLNPLLKYTSNFRCDREMGGGGVIWRGQFHYRPKLGIYCKCWREWMIKLCLYTVKCAVKCEIVFQVCSSKKKNICLMFIRIVITKWLNWWRPYFGGFWVGKPLRWPGSNGFFCDVGWDRLSTYGVSCWGAFHMKKPPGLPVWWLESVPWSV